MWLCFPVRIDARDGPQIEFVQMLLVKSIPSFAMRSIDGVGATLSRIPPGYAEMASGE